MQNIRQIKDKMVHGGVMKTMSRREKYEERMNETKVYKNITMTRKKNKERRPYKYKNKEKKQNKTWWGNVQIKKVDDSREHKKIKECTQNKKKKRNERNEEKAI